MDETRYFTRQEAQELLGSAVKPKKTLDDIGHTVAGTPGEVTDAEESANMGSFIVRIRWYRKNYNRPVRRYYSKDAYEEWVIP